jgi:hypothetical protein
MYRRSLLQLIGASVAALPWRGSLAQAQAAPLGEAAARTLRAVAPAVLPLELGTAGVDREVDRFLEWLRGYKSGAEMGFGYGMLRKRVTPTITPETYRQQLESIEQGAPAGSSFGALPIQERQRVITAALERAGVKDFPSSPDGTHVISDFMSFYFTSTEANDLCYRAAIGRERCRTLAGSSTRPAPIAKA